MRTPGPAGSRQRVIRPGVGAKCARRVLGADAQLDGVAVRDRPRRRRRPWTASESGWPAATQSCSWTRSRSAHQLGHAVLDLEPGVDLEEVDVAPSARPGTPRSPRCAGRPTAATRTARVEERARAGLGVRPGAGASSTSFWWRRWVEQSRSPSATMAPWLSPSSWTSTWRRALDVVLEVDRSIAEGLDRLARRGRAPPPRRSRGSRRRAACPGRRRRRPP